MIITAASKAEKVLDYLTENFDIKTPPSVQEEQPVSAQVEAQHLTLF
jgi:hypothetical protein